MLDDDGLIPPGPEASPEAWTAYRQAYSEREMAAHRRHREALHSELRAKVRYADGERALAAFTRVMEAAGLDAWAAADAQFKLESWDDRGFPADEGPNEAEGLAAAVWREAIEAGRVELCDKKPFVSEEAFGLIDFLDREPGATFEGVFPLRLMKA